ncbi:N-acetyltransferase [Microbacterium protaetiae]|uniref:N-acetyltransferase n=1 Tax=Microbacterium protaetiae TaxID=2509458 RepID=A0A4P6EDV9_9MICO|nr:GNAT family protein [Microbacterium protaetiae]QAY60465.1 N-acetyltransferase [Microbacterium protaetiae]
MSEAQWSSSDEAFEYGSGLLTDGTVALRALRPADLSELVTWWNSPEWASLQQRIIKPRPDTPIEEMFQTWSTNKPLGDTGFSIVSHHSGDLLGHLTLYGASLPARSASFAIMVGPEHVGHGIGPKATLLALSYGFRELGLNRVELHAWAFNTRAIRAYEKAGFVVEGRRREAVFHDGRFHDELIMSVLARDYFAE